MISCQRRRGGDEHGVGAVMIEASEAGVCRWRPHTKPLEERVSVCAKRILCCMIGIGAKRAILDRRVEVLKRVARCVRHE